MEFGASVVDGVWGYGSDGGGRSSKRTVELDGFEEDGGVGYLWEYDLCINRYGVCNYGGSWGFTSTVMVTVVRIG
uniref:Uncharacterized protein n=1 Tax=Cannabis sativa TaxID=3483 RepID=A0A803P1A0_CANSA